MALVRRALGGEREAGSESVGLEAFVAEHYPRLVRLAGLITRDLGDAQDAVQAGLERAWRARHTLADEQSMRHWVDRIVVREAIRVGQQRRRFFLATGDRRATNLEPRDERAGPPEVVSIRLAYERLSTDQRAVIVLHLHAGYSVAETAELLGVPHDTVRSRLRAARQRLRLEMAEEAS